MLSNVSTFTVKGGIVVSLLESYKIIKAEHAQIEARYRLECQCSEIDCPHATELDESENTLEAARLELAESQEIRSWDMVAEFEQDPVKYDLTVMASSAQDAFRLSKIVIQDLLALEAHVKITVCCCETGEEETLETRIQPGYLN